MSSLLVFLLESELNELIDGREKIDKSNIFSFYQEILISYLSSDIKKLEAIGKIKNKFSNSDHFSYIETLFYLRRSILLNQYDPKKIEIAESLAKESSIWQGELYFVLAMCYEGLAEEGKAQGFYQKAAAHFETIGAPQKSLKSLHNKLASQTRSNSDTNYFIEFNILLNKAKELKAFPIAASCCTNLSRDFQLIGSTSTALDYIDQAISYLQTQIGSYDYWMAIAQKIHLLIELERYTEAEKLTAEMKISSHKIAKEILKSIQILWKKEASINILQEDLPPHWKNRHKEKNNKEKLAPLEEKFIAFLSTGPKDKFEIIAELYGSDLAFQSAELRFKNILSRIRKKKPKLIVFEKKKYKLIQKIF